MNTWTLLFAAIALSACTAFAVLARRHAALQRACKTLLGELEGCNEQLEIFTGAMSDELQAPLRQLHRIVRQPMQLESVDMGALAREVAASLSSRYPSSTVRVADLPRARGDRALLERAWLNLIENALKFSAHAQSPRIDIGARSTDRETEYWVRDNGTGFDMAHRHRLFEVFQRLHQADEYAGIGTGLVMVRLIVARHGGTVRAQGKAGEGATFTMVLPNAQ